MFPTIVSVDQLSPLGSKKLLILAKLLSSNTKFVNLGETALLFSNSNSIKVGASWGQARNVKSTTRDANYSTNPKAKEHTVDGL